MLLWAEVDGIGSRRVKEEIWVENKKMRSVTCAHICIHLWAFVSGYAAADVTSCELPGRFFWKNTEQEIVFCFRSFGA